MKNAASRIPRSEIIVTEKDRRRFLAKVKRTRKCWIWTGAIMKSNSGYGTIGIGGVMRLAHRVAWIIKNGRVPELLLVLHSCDNPACVRPSHLWVGTQKQNIQDMINKNRGARGLSVGAKLSEDQVKQMRSSGRTQQSLAKQYGINQATVWAILNRVTYRYVE